VKALARGPNVQERIARFRGSPFDFAPGVTGEPVDAAGRYAQGERSEISTPEGGAHDA
jgi:hypothetical protein